MGMLIYVFLVSAISITQRIAQVLVHMIRFFLKFWLPTKTMMFRQAHIDSDRWNIWIDLVDSMDWDRFDRWIIWLQKGYPVPTHFVVLKFPFHPPRCSMVVYFPTDRTTIDRFNGLV